MAATLGPVRGKFRHFDTPDDEVWVKWFRCPQGDLTTLSLSPALGSAMTGETVPWGFICTDTEGEPDGNETLIKATYKKVKRLDTATDLSEIDRYGPRIALPNGRLSGTRIYLAPDATANAEIVAHLPLYRAWSHEALDDVTWTWDPGTAKTSCVVPRANFYSQLVGRLVVITGVAGTWTITNVDSATQFRVAGNAVGGGFFSIGGEPVLLEVTPIPFWRTGLTRIITRWGVAPTWHRLEQTVGAGILECRASMVGEKRTYDNDAAKIDMEWRSTTHHYRYVPVTGSAVVPVPKIEYTIRVVLTSAGLAVCAALFGKINAGACADIGGAAAKTLWFNGFHFIESEESPGLYHTTVNLAYNADDWDSWLTVEKQEKMSVSFPVFDTAGADTGRKNTYAFWQSTGDPIEDRVILGTGDFGAINGYV